MAMFPYLLNPIVKLPIIKRFALPHSGDKRGVGKVMKVSVQRANETPILNFWQLRDNLVKDSKTNNKQSLLKSLTNIVATQKHSLSDDDLNAEVLMMMVAAPDTTSALICSVVNQVIQHPDVHRKLVSEIMVATAAGNLNHPVATFAQIKDLPFFTACIKESARLSPSIPVVIPRRVSQGGLVLKGLFIPEGTAIGASAVVLNRNPDVFGEDATAFRPGRWLEQSDRINQMHRLIFSWGFGTRKCIGKNLALLETYKFCFQGNRVDFLVAYIAALKAGATVGVLDPQYPPERQKILLDVARPRFLALASVIDRVQDLIGLRFNAMPLSGDEDVEDEAYAADARGLVRQLPQFIRSAAADWAYANHPPTVFLTGATGFLGSYVLHELSHTCEPRMQRRVSIGSRIQ
ncbi:MAG: hypothetical protein Q9164_006624 [Protoblastenia rupestris]